MFKYPFKSIYCLILIASNIAFGANHSTLISYQKAIQIALQNNPRIKSTDYQIHSARAELSRIKGTEFPKFNFGFNAGLSDNPMDVFGYKLSQGTVTFNDFGLGEFKGPSSINTAPQNLNSPGYYNNFNKGFRLSVPLYAGGSFMAQKNAALSHILTKKIQAASIKNQLAYDVIQAYFGSIAANQLILISQENLNKSKAYKKLTQELRHQSQTLESDSLLSQAFLRASEHNLLSQKAQYLNQVDVLHNLLNTKTNILQPFGKLSILAPSTPAHKWINLVLTENPKLHELNEQLHTVKHLDIIKAKTLPQINLNMHHDWNGQRVASGLPNNMVALNLDWELLNIGERGAELKKIQAKYAELLILRDEMRNTLRLSIQQALRARKIALAQKLTFEKNIQDIQLANQQLTERFGKGLTPLAIVLDSQVRLTEAKSQKIQAEYNLVMANAQLLMLGNKIIPRIACERS